MEGKPAAGGTPGGAEPSASAEPGSNRRRGGGQKRKSSSISNLNPLFSSTPSKRVTREKAAGGLINHTPAYHLLHNGPLTRARQSPCNLEASSSSPSATVKSEDKAVVGAPKEDGRRKLEELEAAMESEFEAIRSRDSNAHVVPSHCGWFSWTNVHLIEERSLPSFFDGNSPIRTRDSYLKIRNWIIKRFHANPNVQVQLKDLDELDVGDLETRQEVFEFLDHWGLINFHPFLKMDFDGGDVVVENKDLLLKKLFQFDAIQPPATVVPKVNAATPVVASRLLTESAIAEELARAEGPDVEYHCNSCSADCSRRRYHCQKQADYDLCADCFNNGKFDSDMSSSDFILMEPAEAQGINGGKWTDQETLLLLEALEIFEDNWSEIAEHVATKTKAQCILHFLQMPIKDSFLDCDDDVGANSKEIDETAATIDGTSAANDAPKTADGKASATEDEPLTSEMEAPKPDDASDLKVSSEATKVDNGCEVIPVKESSKPEDTSQVKSIQTNAEDFAVKALHEAFDAVGYLTVPKSPFSFADVGNPVMALAGFLARLVGPEIATASSRFSLKSLSCSSPGLQLAARHCFLLEDPPDSGAVSNCVATEIAPQDTEEDNPKHENHNGSNLTLISGDKELSNNYPDKKTENPLSGDNIPPDPSYNTSGEKVDTVKESDSGVAHEDFEHLKTMDSNEHKFSKDHSPGMAKELDESHTKTEHPPDLVKKPQERSSEVEQFQVTKVTEEVNMESTGKPPEKDELCQLVMCEKVPLQTANTLKVINMAPDSQPSEKNELLQLEKSETVGDGSKSIEALKDSDKSSVGPGGNEPLQPDTQPSAVDDGAAENHRDSKREKTAGEEVKEDHSIDKLKRAAISALSAAAVKAKLLANQEEEQIQQLVASLIEKQLHKLEMKLAFFNDVDNAATRVREQFERSRQRLYHERAQIIAARLGLPASSSRVMPPLPSNRIPMNFANSVPRPPMGMISQRPTIPRPMGAVIPTTPSNPFVSATTAGTSIRPSGQENISSVGTK